MNHLKKIWLFIAYINLEQSLSASEQLHNTMSIYEDSLKTSFIENLKDAIENDKKISDIMNPAFLYVKQVIENEDKAILSCDINPCYNHMRQVIKACIDEPVINEQTKYGKVQITLLESALKRNPESIIDRENNLEMIRFLIKAGVNINHHIYGQTPLMHAIDCNRIDLIKEFLATPNIDINYNMAEIEAGNALSTALRHNTYYKNNKINSTDIIKLLLAAPGIIITKDNFNAAFEFGNVDIVELGLQAGMPVLPSKKTLAFIRFAKIRHLFIKIALKTALEAAQEIAQEALDHQIII